MLVEWWAEMFVLKRPYMDVQSMLNQNHVIIVLIVMIVMQFISTLIDEV
jgi:hypothetical protein